MQRSPADQRPTSPRWPQRRSRESNGIAFIRATQSCWMELPSHSSLPIRPGRCDSRTRIWRARSHWCATAWCAFCSSETLRGRKKTGWWRNTVIFAPRCSKSGITAARPAAVIRFWMQSVRKLLSFQLAPAISTVIPALTCSTPCRESEPRCCVLTKWGPSSCVPTGFTSRSKRKEKNGSWHKTRQGTHWRENRAPEGDDPPVPGSGAGNVSSRWLTGTDRWLGIGNQHGSRDHTLENDLCCADDCARTGAPLARAPSRPPISATLGLSCQLSLAIHSLRLHE